MVPVSGRTLSRVAAETAAITIHVYSDLLAAERQWRALEQTADHTVFQTFDWLMNWCRHIGVRKDLRPVIVVGSVNRETCFLLPMAIERVAHVRKLVWLGVDAADYNVPLLASNFRSYVPPGQFPSVWKQIVNAIRSQNLHFDVVELDKMPPEIPSQTIEGYSVINPFCDLKLWHAEYSAHAAVLTDSWEEFYKSKTSSTGRQADRRKLRRLSEHGEVRFVEVVEPDEIQNTMTALIEQKRASYRRMGVSDIFACPGYEEFYRAIALGPVAHVTRVDIGDDLAATGLALRFKDRYLMILHSYQDKYARYSPGGYHIQQLIQYAIAHRMRIFDFTIGDEAYKDNWCDVVSPLLRYYESKTIRGETVVWLSRLRHYAVLCYRWYKR